MRHVVCADDNLEGLLEVVGPENVGDLVVQRAGRNAKRECAAEPRHTRGRRRKQDVATLHARVVLAPLLGHDCVHFRRRDLKIVVGKKRLEQVAVVVAEIAIEVRRAGQRPSARAEHVLKGCEVQSLAVGKHAVEIEHHAPADHLNCPLRRSPAGIDTCRRFSRGGTGQS